LNVNETGKIIIANNQFLTLQKGRPYFFPNCKNEEIINKTNLQYKTIAPTRIQPRFQTNRFISLNYYDLTKLAIKRTLSFKEFLKTKVNIKTEFSKLFLKKNGKFYSSLIPQFFKKFSIRNTRTTLKCEEFIRPKESQYLSSGKMDKTLLMQSSELIKNQYKNFADLDYQLVLVKFLEHPFTKTTKSIGLYSITEDYFEQDVNSVFCKNSEFIEEGETIGLLNTSAL